MGKVVCQVAPAMFVPFNASTTELAVTGRDTGIVQKASAYASPGQPVRRVRDASGTPAELWVGGAQLVPKDAILAEATQRYRKARPRRSALSK
jgi:D-alanyl-D-alanine carboxypeptidase